MTNAGKKSPDRIACYFDTLSIGRDYAISEDPILEYEQRMRQQCVLSLLSSSILENALDIGCGNARDMIEIAGNAKHVVGLDISPEMIRSGREKARRAGAGASMDFIIGSATQLPFIDSAFNKILCSEVLEHVPEFGTAIEETERVLTKGGVVVFSSPNKISPRWFWKSLALVSQAMGLTMPHPWDEWKTKKSLITAIKRGGLHPLQTRGVCYVPIPPVRFLPDYLKRMALRLVEKNEVALSEKLDWLGYMVAVSAKKGS